MIDSSALWVFIAAALVLLVSPGPAVLFIVARSIDQGSRAGLVSTLGMCAGGIVHVSAAAFGLSAILMSSALVFSVVKLAGAAYLVFLGIRTLASGRAIQTVEAPPRTPLRNIFAQAVIVQVLNPKAAVFMLAFLPQFVDPARGSVVMQVFTLGAVFHALALVTDSTYALLAGRLSGWLKGSTRALRSQRYAAGITYIVLGIATAASGARHK